AIWRPARQARRRSRAIRRLDFKNGGKPARIEVDMRAIKGTGEFAGAEVTVIGMIISRQYVERGAVLILKAESVAR
ncbi:MAG: hypothetical protein VCA35_08525, partial [Roseibacillus sp.]